MVRKAKRTKKREANGDDVMMPQFSAAFITEVGGCQDIAAFQELLEHKGLWLNRNAAEDVFGYLHSMSNRQLSDEDLTSVVGGAPVPWGARPDDQLIATLQILSDQLNGAF